MNSTGADPAPQSPLTLTPPPGQVAMEDEKRAMADRDLAVKKAAYKAEVNHAEATAQVAFDIEKAKQGQTVVREQTKQRAEEALVMLDVQGTEALTAQKQKEGVSLAMLIEEKNRAEAIRAKADVRYRRPCCPASALICLLFWSIFLFISAESNEKT